MKRTKQVKNNRLSPKQKTFLKTYWVHLLFLFFLVNYIITRSLQLYFYAQSCLTKTQISSDSRCLYIYGNNVYEMGTRDRPHKGHTCGIDVTSFIPGFHIQSMATYMDPSLIGAVCSDAPPTPTPIPPTATPSPIPTSVQQPTHTPYPTAVSQATSTPIPNQQTNTPIPTATSSLGQNLIPTATLHTLIKPSPTKKTFPSPTKAPTPTPIKHISNPNGTGFGKFVNEKAATQDPITQQTKVTRVIAKKVPWTPLITFSQALVIGSFFLMIIVTLAGIVKRILKK